MNINWSTSGTWALKAIAALIMLQTLYYKFSGAEESVYIFTSLGMEPWGRFSIGILELVASLLILYPRTSVLGAALGAGLMSGAMFFHLTKLGIAVRGDGGQLFIYALVTFLCCVSLMLIYRDQLISFAKQVLGKSN